MLQIEIRILRTILALQITLQEVLTLLISLVSIQIQLELLTT